MGNSGGPGGWCWETTSKGESAVHEGAESGAEHINELY
jgi:hypothetical protein